MADFRLALWGSALEPVNERYLTENLPTLRGIREAVARASTRPGDTADSEGSGPPLVPQERPPVTSAPGPADSDSPMTPWLLASGAALVATAAGLFHWQRWKARRR